MLLATLTLLLAPISSCEVAPTNPLLAIAEIPACGTPAQDAIYEVFDLEPDLTESAHSGHGDIRLVVNRPSSKLPDGFTGSWPKPKTTVTFYDRHLFTSGSQGPMNGTAVVNDDGTFEIWVPAQRNGGFKERSVLIRGRVDGSSIVIDEYRYIDDFVPENSSGTIHKSRREYKKGPVTHCFD